MARKTKTLKAHEDEAIAMGNSHSKAKYTATLVFSRHERYPDCIEIRKDGSFEQEISLEHALYLYEFGLEEAISGAVTESKKFQSKFQAIKKRISTP